MLKGVVLTGALIASCAGVTKLILGGPKTCPEPPTEYHNAPLITCGLPEETNPNAVCCAYAMFQTGTSAGELCFHVLCKPEACGEYTFVQTICGGPEGVPSKDASNWSEENEEPS